MNYHSKRQQAGQIGIVILMLMAVILTIGISLSQRTIQEQDIAIIQDESTRVFNAAESGLEQALFQVSVEDFTGTGSLDLDGINVDYETNGSATFDMNLSSGKAVTIPLNVSSPTNVTVRWWDQIEDCGTSNPPAAVLASIYTANNVRHFGFDPCASSRNNNLLIVNKLASVDEGCNYKVDIPVAVNDILIRVKPVFNNSKFNINSNAIDLAQYNILSSAQNNLDDIVRTLNVKRSLLSAPGFMDYALVSGNDLIKN